MLDTASHTMDPMTTTTPSTRQSSIAAWVIESGVEESFRGLSYAVAIISTLHGKVGLYANPTDRRCYRLIARPLVATLADMTLNQLQTLQESLAVATAVAVFKQVMFRHAGLFVQSLHLGNNSMQQQKLNDDESQDGCIVGLGNIYEPYFYHEHLFLRGDPKRSYFEGAPALAGPTLGVALGAQDGGRVKPKTFETQALVKGLQGILRESGNNDDVWQLAGCSVDALAG